MKELIVILAIAGLTFRLAKPTALRFSAGADFLRRRNVWFALTVIAFLSPNFWVFAFFAVPIYIWTGRKDSNPIAAYLLLMHVVPPVSVDLPAIGVSQLFSLDNYRLLSFCILIPIALRVRRSIDRDRTARPPIWRGRCPIEPRSCTAKWSRGGGRSVRRCRPHTRPNPGVPR